MQKTYRIRGVALSRDYESLELHLNHLLRQNSSGNEKFTVKSLAYAAALDSQVATVDFDAEPALFQDENHDQWTLSVRKRKLRSTDQVMEDLALDSHFRGLTPLQTGREDGRNAARINIIAISGLGSHAFGSFKERGRAYMWIRDALGSKVPTANTWIYGFDSTIHESKSVQNIDDIARGLVSSLREIMHSSVQQSEPDQHPPNPRRLILIGHSLGGLVIKQALIRLDTHSKADSDISKALCGVLFFGVPNQGMAFRSLLAMCNEGPNEGLLRTLMENSEVIRIQQEQFRKCTALKGCQIHCFYETQLSPTAIRDNHGRWKMDGPDEYLVTYESATYCLEGALSSANSHAVDASHSDMVKFRPHDPHAESVFRVLTDVIAGTETEEDSGQAEHDPISGYYRGFIQADAPIITEDLFFGQSEELKEMKSFLLNDQRLSNRQLLILGGMGGIGKTQVALRHAQKHKSSYSSIFWLNAATELTLTASVRRIAPHILGDQDFIRLKDQELWTKVLLWLSEPENNTWLLIYDNYDDPNQYSIQQYLPAKAQGSIIITTRQPDEVHGYHIRVQPLSDIQDSLRILAARSGRSNTLEDAGAHQLAQRLDGLPLALATAGAFLKQSSISFSKYLERYENMWQITPGRQRKLPDYGTQTLYTTWDISLSQIEDEVPHVRSFLAFLAYLDHQDIWYNLLHIEQDDNHPEWFQEITIDEFCFEQIMATLARFCLVESHSQSYSLHVCVHDWTFYLLSMQIDSALYQLAFKCISQSCILGNSASSWTENKRLFPHLQRLLSGRFADFLKQDPDVVRTVDYFTAGVLLKDQDRLSQSERMYMRALQGYEKSLGPYHISTLVTVHGLGHLYRDQGKLDKAEQMHEQALQGSEKSRGPDHTSTLSIVTCLGDLYRDQDKLNEAEQMYMRALQGFEKTLGQDHELTLTKFNRLGDLYRDQDKLNEAEQMYVRALQGFEKTLGQDHKLTLDTFNNLGDLYHDQDKLNEAEQMYMRALQGFEKTLGQDHKLTLDTFNNLGDLYRGQDKLDEAEQMYMRALQGFEKSLGQDHKLTLDTFNNLGDLYRGQDKLDEAEKMYMRALQGFEKSLGQDHKSTLDTVHNLGHLYRDQGKLDKAEQMHIRALQGYEKSLGPDHTSTFKIVNCLGKLYRDQDKLNKAEQMYMRALQGFEKTLGQDHKSTLDIIHNLGHLYGDQGKSNEAEKTHIRAIQGSEKSRGPDHTSTLGIVRCLGHIYYNQGKLDSAEKMYIRALKGYEKALVLDHTMTLRILNDLGGLYYNQGKLDSAEQMYMRALQGFEKTLGQDHKLTLDTFDNLGDLYRGQDKLDSAEKMYIRVLQGKEKSLGPDHTSTLGIVYKLGGVYRDQGKLDSAEKMYMRALQGYEALGTDHTSTLDIIHNLGHLYGDQGKLNEGEEMHIRAIQGYEKLSGPDHTSTLNMVNCLGHFYRGQGKLDSAEKMYIRALKGYEKSLGPDHELTLEIVHQLGHLYSDQGHVFNDQGKLEDAEQMHIRAIQGYEKSLGPGHTSTLHIVDCLGHFYRRQSKLDSAEKMYMRTLKGYEEALGPDHTSTLRTRRSLEDLRGEINESTAINSTYSQPTASKSARS